MRGGVHGLRFEIRDALERPFSLPSSWPTSALRSLLGLGQCPGLVLLLVVQVGQPVGHEDGVEGPLDLLLEEQPYSSESGGTQLSGLP